MPYDILIKISSQQVSCNIALKAESWNLKIFFSFLGGFFLKQDILWALWKIKLLLIVGSKLSNTDTANNKIQISGFKSEAPSLTPSKKTSNNGDNIYSSFCLTCILIGGTKIPQCVMKAWIQSS